MLAKAATIRMEKSKNTKIKNEICLSPQQPKNDSNNNNDNNPRVSAKENHSHIFIGPRNVGISYYLIKILQKKKDLFK